MTYLGSTTGTNLAGGDKNGSNFSTSQLELAWDNIDVGADMVGLYVPSLKDAQNFVNVLLCSLKFCAHSRRLGWILAGCPYFGQLGSSAFFLTSDDMFGHILSHMLRLVVIYIVRLYTQPYPAPHQPM